MANSKKSTTTSNKVKLDTQKGAKGKNKSTEQANVPDQPLADMNE